MRIYLNPQTSGSTTKAYTRLPIENYKTVNPKSGCGHLIKGGGCLQGVLSTELWQTGKNFGILDTGCGHLNACIHHLYISQNTFCLSPKILHKLSPQFLPGITVFQKRHWRHWQCLCKILGVKQGVLWGMCKWQK